MLIPLISAFNFDRTVALGGTALGMLGTGLAVYYGRRSEKVRKPTFSVQEGRDLLVKKVVTTFSGFEVLHRGNKVTDDVVGMHLRFWNSGNLAILKADVLTPFQALYPPECKILDVSILAVSRSEVAAKLTTTDNLIVIEAVVIEPNDGLTVQVLYSGPVDPTLSFSGSCIGAASPLILPPELARHVPISGTLRSFIKGALPILFAMGMFVAAGSYHGRYISTMETIASWIGGLMGGLILAALIVFEVHRWFNTKRIPSTLVKD